MKTKAKEYICQVCKRKVLQKDAITHIQAEEYILKLIEKDHPKWTQDGKICKGCVNYYRTLVKNAKI